MKNSKVELTDLKESNMNQLVASEMFMIRGGGGYKGGKKSGKKSGKKGKDWYCGCCW